MGTLHSERLEYLKYKAPDYFLYHELSSNSKVMKYITGRPLAEAETKIRFEKILLLNEKHEKPGVFIVRDLITKDYLGLAKATIYGEGEIEIGYALMPPFWGKGFGYEISKKMVSYGRVIENAKAIVGIIDPANLVSKRILEKCGLSFFEDTLIDGQPGAVYKMSLL
jgi:RimJ/RimL family protein N-acetyltransferase